MTQMQDSKIGELLTIREVCELLKISRSTLTKLTREKEVDPIKVRGSIRYDYDKIQQLLGN